MSDPRIALAKFGRSRPSDRSSRCVSQEKEGGWFTSLRYPRIVSKREILL
jgi:hypothetical protein